MACGGVVMNIVLRTFDDLNTFQKGVKFYAEDIDVRQGRYLISGHSYLGMCSLDLSKPIDVTINTESKRIEDNFYNYLKKWEVKN